MGALAATFAATGGVARAALTVYDLATNGGAAGFNAVIGGPVTTIDFDGIAANTDITGTTTSGVKFNTPAGGAPLVVVNASATFTPAGFNGVANANDNRLIATSGANVLSPGGLELGPGTNDSIENDDLELVFAPPVKAFAFDHLSQSADGLSFTILHAFNQANVEIYADIVPISDVSGAGGPAGNDFWGAIADGGDFIGRIVIEESDNDANFPDCNIGFDTFRTVAAPEPTSLFLASAAGLSALLAPSRSTRRRGR